MIPQEDCVQCGDVWIRIDAGIARSVAHGINRGVVHAQIGLVDVLNFRQRRAVWGVRCNQFTILECSQRSSDIFSTSVQLRQIQAIRCLVYLKRKNDLKKTSSQ